MPARDETFGADAAGAGAGALPLDDELEPELLLLDPPEFELLFELPLFELLLEPPLFELLVLAAFAAS